MTKLTLPDIGSLANTTSAREALNNNFDAIETALENTLSRDGTTPNNMTADLDMDGNAVLNVADPVAETDAVNKRSVSPIVNDVVSEIIAALGDPAFLKVIEVAVSAEDDTISLIPFAPFLRVVSVIYNGIYQNPSSYTANTNTITFSEPLPADGKVVMQLLCNTLDSSDSSNVNTIQTATGAITRSVREKLSDIVSVLDFSGVDKSGATDSTVGIQAAIDHVSIAGGTLYFPPGTYLVSDTLTINSNGVHLQGAGMWNTIITRSGDYGDTFLFTGDDLTGTLLTDCGFGEFTIKSTGLTTSGAHLHLNGIARFHKGPLYLVNGYIGIKSAGLTAAYFERDYFVFTNIYGGSATGRRFMSFVSAAATYAHPSCGDVFITDFNVRGNTANQNTEYGLYIESGDGIWFENGHVGNTASANIMLNAVDASNHIGLLFFNSVMSDEGAGYGLRFAGSSAVARNIQFSNCNFKGGGNGLDGISSDATATFNNVQFSNCFVTEYDLRGVHLISAGLKNWDFTGTQVRGNSYDAALYPGVNLQNVKDFRFVGGKFGGQNVNADVAGNQTYGLVIGTGVENIVVSGVDLRDNATDSIAINGAVVGQVTMSGCIGQSSASVASASTLTLPEIGEVFHVTGTTTITNIQVSRTGRRVTLIFDDVLSFTDGGNKKLASAFATTADDTISLVYDGTNWYETGRSVN